MYTHRSTRRRPHVIDPAKVAWTIVLCVALAAVIVAAAPSFAQSTLETTESGTTGHEDEAICSSPTATILRLPRSINAQQRTVRRCNSEYLRKNRPDARAVIL